MRPFTYHRAKDVADAANAGKSTRQGQVDAPVQYLAGGTTLVDLMKLNVLTPGALVDITPLAAEYAEIKADASGLELGALARMAEVADHPTVKADYPVVAQSLQQAASAQLRNMATLGGNLLQRTRCAYYRDPSWTACNKRRPGSGCAALQGVNRNFAVMGVDQSCIAQYPGDFAVALVALDAELVLAGPNGARTLPLASLHRAAEGKPHLETNLKPGELITTIRVPLGPWLKRSLYLKVRDRASYEFALASAAVALELEGDMVRQARIGLGGIAYRPWRAHEAEAALVGQPLTPATAEAAAKVALAGAVTHGGNKFKPELARRTLVRALLQAKAMEL